MDNKFICKPGNLYEDGDRNYYVACAINYTHHLDPGILINIFSGEAIHISKLKEPITERYGSEIMW